MKNIARASNGASANGNMLLPTSADGHAPGSTSIRGHAPSMQKAIQGMAKVLRDENAALAAMDFVRAGTFLAPKHDAANELAAAWRAADVEPSATAQLQELGRLAEENRLLLTRAMRVQRRVLDLVARAARQAQPQTAYGAAGRYRTPPVAPQNLKTRM